MLLLYRFWQNISRIRNIHLHSTMLLLYRYLPIYQPCIHSHLHSTMLLLYRGCVGTGSGEADPFTFHYASTLSSQKFRDILNSQFTFHYASTLSRTSFSLLFSSIQVYSLSTLFSSLDSPQKSSYPHFTKYEFPLIFQALSISQQFFSISGRQS